MEYVYFVEKGSVKLGIFASCGKSLTKDIIYDSVLFGKTSLVQTPSTKNLLKR